MEENKSNNNNILLGILIAIVIFGLGALGGYYYCKIQHNSNTPEKNNTNNPVESNDNNENKENDPTPAKEPEDYTKYVKTEWTNENINESLSITEIEDGKMDFSWRMLRIDLIKEDLPWNLGFNAVLPFKDGITTFYYNGYEDKNNNNEEDDGEHYYRKGIIELKNNKVYVNLEEVTKEEFENNLSLDVTDAFTGSVYFELKDYVYYKPIPYLDIDLYTPGGPSSLESQPPEN